MEVFNWGIIGPGKIAKEFVADMKHVENSHHKLGAVLSHNLEKAEHFADEELAPQAYDNIQSFLKGANIDAVYIATPHSLHFKEALLCLASKIPVLCEKPMGVNRTQVNEMVSASIWHNTFLLEGMWVRFLPSITKVLDWIDHDRIGKIVSIKSSMSFKAPPDPESRYFNPNLAGGSLLDLGIYNVFLSLLLLGKPSKIKATAKLSSGKIDEHSSAYCNYDSGAWALLESSLIADLDNAAEIQGEKGKITIRKPWNEKPSAIVLETKDGTEEFKSDWEGRGFQYEIEEVYNCIQMGKIHSSRFCHSFSLDMVTMMDEIRRQTGIIYPFD